ncbi:fatty acid synthase-like isoform X1 [Neodiprion fabricii]|uniref:fatty acid synthase-like isoform X1 n=2 Tax=Neodiprion fabricii TaxID=2872261 RepID=UPI001ED8C456|nr:fatty acid synthase-like isoform X1 [Neodiprion fabricii]XP_046416457.1 fatty acid synthase-like isoform X1 [Neodiprion fabricii]
MSEESGNDVWSKRLPFPKPGDEIVISGIAGRFPESDNLTHFRENLFNKADLITDDDRRWKLENPDIPQRTGKINDINKLDAQFFGVNVKEAHTMDPMSRMLLEHTYEAIVDAGVNPEQLRRTNTGVFVGACYNDSAREWLYSTLKVDGLGLLGCSKAMMANRLSQWLGCTGPSYTVDTACSSSLFAMDSAYRAIRTGECEAAIVAGANLSLHPNVSHQFFHIGVLSSDGRCKSFDNEANGYARSEAVCVVYLQKSKDAKRNYANVVYTKTNCDGFKKEGITYPSCTIQQRLLEEFYVECKIPPSSLAFVEAHGTGTSVGDPVELEAIDKVFCPGRTTPLRIGSIKSNMGHSEPTSGLCSIAKVLIAMESGYIPPNLNYNHPHEGVEALKTGRIQVISETTPWEGGYVGINSFGFGGSNAHVLLKSNVKEKIRNGSPDDDMPRLVVVSGRTVEAVNTLLDDLESRPVDVEYVSLFHDLHATEIPGHPYRGYTILPSRGVSRKNVRDVQYYSGAKLSTTLIFDGFGSEWVKIGQSLLQVPVFAKALQKCNSVLRSYGVDIFDIFNAKDLKSINNVTNSLVGTTAIQIGLVDVLSSLGIAPDYVIGYSDGILGCAYADGCLTAEQAVLVAHFKGNLLTKGGEWLESSANDISNHEDLTPLPKPNSEVINDVVTENSSSGKQEKCRKNFTTKAYVEFDGNETYTGITNHGQNIVADGPKKLTYLRRVIPNPKPRSQKWVQSNKCENSSDRLFSPEYCFENLMNPVKFENVSSLIPENAITIRMGPHNCLPMNRINITLTQGGTENYLEFLLIAIGKMYEIGLNPQMSKFYPKVQYPVSRETPTISPLVRWDHTEDWWVMRCDKIEKLIAGERVVHIDLAEDEFEAMAGHVVDGRNLVPATGYLKSIWQTVAMMQAQRFDETSVVFENVKFHRATTIPKKGDLTLELTVHKGSGRFEVVEGGTSVVTGFVRTVLNAASERTRSELLPENSDELVLTTRDIYKELRLRGYQYAGLFRGLKQASVKGTKGLIAWERHWEAFMDNMLQIKILGIDTRGLFVPTGIQKLVIDAKAHSDQLRSMPDKEKVFSVEFHKDMDIIISGGVEIRGLKASAIPRRRLHGDPVLENYKFVAHRDKADTELQVVTNIATQIVLENHSTLKIKTIELFGVVENLLSECLISPLIQKVLNNLPLLQADINVIAPLHEIAIDAVPDGITISEPKKLSAELDALLVVTHGLLWHKDARVLKEVQAVIKDTGFILAREPLNANVDSLRSDVSENFDVILEKSTSKELLLLLRRKQQLFPLTTVVRVNNDEFTWIETLQAALKGEKDKAVRHRNRVLLVSEGDYESGLIGLVNCLRKEPGGELVRGLLIQDSQAPKFSLNDPFYSQQLQLDLALNVLRSGKLWGSYRFFPMEPLALKPVYHAQINQYTRGDLSTLNWVEGTIQPDEQQRDIIKVHYSSLNFRDVMLATGKLVEVAPKTRQEHGNLIGFEFSGRDTNGRAVMGMVRTGALSNLCVCDRDLLWAVPDSWTLEDAATVPVVYGTAYYALMLSGKMKKGDKVLIHAGTGGVGQAAITLALHEGCEVFTTVGTPEKREFIRKQFPQIDDDHIGNSRDTSFEQLILRETRGRGVDIVLNSLAEEKLQASVRCLATGGRFLEIGKFDLAADNPIGMEAFLKGISFHGIFLDTLFTASSIEKMKLAAMLTEGMKAGAIKPLIRTVFPIDQVEAAFRYMAAGKHIGKVIVKSSNDTNVHLPLALPRYYCSKDGSYLILGGLGGFGLELADWLVFRGARKLVFTSRKGISSGYQRMRIDIWKSYGVEILVVAGEDASSHEGCEAILKKAAALGPVYAIFNLAVVLRDALYEDQTVESFEESFRAKARATKQLDKLSRTLCPELKQFVIFSSVSCGRGNVGQTNYGMANSIMERICERRAAENLPGLAVQWGAIGDVGLVADMNEEHKELVIGGTLQQRIISCLQVLDGFLQQNCPVVSSMVVADKATHCHGAGNIIETVLNIMGLKDLKNISMHTPLSELGMDSMTAVEIKQTLERDFDVTLTTSDIRVLNFHKLQNMAMKDSIEDERQTRTVQEIDEFAGIKLLIRRLDVEKLDKNIYVHLTTAAETGKEVFMLPGIEGTCTVFKSLASKLKSPAICFQPTAVPTSLTSIHEMTDYFIPHINSKSNERREFVLVGYSFGSIFAVELARRLENQGFTGRLVLLDGSPFYTKELTGSLLQKSDEQMQFYTIVAMMNSVAPLSVAKLTSELQNCSSWDEKLTVFMRNLPEHLQSNVTPDDQKIICSSIYSRLKALKSYECSELPPIKSSIILVKPKISENSVSSEDYGLGSVTSANVKIYYANGNHLTMLDDDICAAAVNGELADDVIRNSSDA